MFGYDFLTAVAALVSVGGILIGILLVLQKNFTGALPPLFIGGAIWTVAGLSSAQAIGVWTAAISFVIALLTSVVAAVTGNLGINLPVLPIVIGLLAVMLLRRNGKKK